jgi:sec-independent protein translocase protein TatC
MLILVPFATLLFAVGVWFTWAVMLPTTIPFLQEFMGITTHVRPASYFDFITRLMFWIGICFELPLIAMFLAKIGVVSARRLLAWWRYALVAIAIIAAAVTPTVDPVSMGLVMAPLAGLYVLSIVLTWFVGRGANG